MDEQNIVQVFFIKFVSVGTCRQMDRRTDVKELVSVLRVCFLGTRIETMYECLSKSFRTESITKYTLLLQCQVFCCVWLAQLIVVPHMICSSTLMLNGLQYMLQCMYEGVPKSFRTGRLELELQMVKFSARKCAVVSLFVSQFSEFCRHKPLYCF